MECRANCGACCIAPSISSAIPGMPGGKPANTRCVHLNGAYQCGIFGQPDRPKVCADFMPELSACGENREEAMSILLEWERVTR